VARGVHPRGAGVPGGRWHGWWVLRCWVLAIDNVLSCELRVSLAYCLLLTGLLPARGDASCTPAAALCAAGRDRAEDCQGAQVAGRAE
jgi:hypothetical protein